MQLIKKYATNNMHHKANRIIGVQRLVLHSVGCSQPDPDIFVRQWDTTTNKYLAQIIIGVDKAYEVLPCMVTRGKAVFCYHAGNVNSTSIGAEMTEPSTIKYTSGANWTDLNPVKTKEHVMATYKNAVDIFAQLCKFHNLNPLADGVILSHSECYKRGIGTGHADVEHIWNKFGLTMDQFRKDVSAAINNTNINTNISNQCPYLAKISIKNLNMRTGPSTNYPSIGYIGPGVYTIVEMNGKWGRIKSQQKYNGKWVDAWIHTDYTKKV